MKRTGDPLSGRIFFLIFFAFFLSSSVSAEVAIETSVDRARVSVGEELTLDIIITNADGPISKPVISQIEGFTSYSQGHSQEISIVNGKSSSRSIFSYVLVANAAGKKSIGPFEITIGGKLFKIAAVQVEVAADNTGPPARNVLQTPVSAPPARALPQGSVSSRDIFVKAWLDRDEVAVNEPAVLTYTLYTRLSATYKGFEKEPATTGFWVEDFPPDKTIKRTEQFFNHSRYVVADVRKLALFPTEPGVFTIDPGVISTTVEVRDQDDFDSFFSYNIFGGRRTAFRSPIMREVVARSLPTDPVTLVVKALPEAGKPPSFKGAVGQYTIQSSVDKTELEQGSPITYRLRIAGQGNINTLEPPALPKIEGFRIYDSSSSVNISKNRLIVEGEKVTETVLVPSQAGTFPLPVLSFSYFDPYTGIYKELKTSPHTVKVSPAPEPEETSLSASGVVPVEKQSVPMMASDIRFIKETESRRFLPAGFYKKPLYWVLNGSLFFLTVIFLFLSRRRARMMKDPKALRFRHSHRVARQKLRSAEALLKKGKHDEFYAEISKAVYGYFADRLGMPGQSVGAAVIEERVSALGGGFEKTGDLRKLFEMLDLGRFASLEKNIGDMKVVYGLAEGVISDFEKVKLR